MKRYRGWYWYDTEDAKLLETHRCGKWMHFFNDQEFAMNICEKAIAENVCYECKCTDMELQGDKTGVICFYSNGDDIENHHRIIQFMIDNQLIQKQKQVDYIILVLNLIIKLVRVSMAQILKE